MSSVTKINTYVNWVLRKHKTPVNREGRAVDALDPANRMTLGDALDALRASLGLSGFGYVVGSGVACIDIDHCRNPISGAIAPKAWVIVDRFPGAFWEVSISGTGLHGWLNVADTLVINRKGTWDGEHSLEVASHGKFFTVENPAVVMAATALPEGLHTDQVLALIADYFPVEPEPAVEPDAVAGDELDDDAILALVLGHPALSRLWVGDYRQYRSHSEADYVLLGALWQATCKQVERTKRLFLQSDLGARKKAKRRDYIPRTLRAIERNHFAIDWTQDAEDDIAVLVARAVGSVRTQDFIDGLGVQRANAVGSGQSVADEVLYAMLRKGTTSGAAITLAEIATGASVGIETVRRAIVDIAKAGLFTVERVFEWKAGTLLPTFRFSLSRVVIENGIHSAGLEAVGFAAIRDRLSGNDAFARGRSKSSRDDAKRAFGATGSAIVRQMQVAASDAKTLAMRLHANVRTLRKHLNRMVTLGLADFCDGIYTLCEDWKKQLAAILPSLATYRIGDERLLKRAEQTVLYRLKQVKTALTKPHRSVASDLLGCARKRVSALKARLGWLTVVPSVGQGMTA